MHSAVRLKSSILACSAAVLCVAAPLAQADTLNFVGALYSTNDVFNLKSTTPAQSINTYAEEFVFNDVTTGKTLDTFCIDIFHYIHSPAGNTPTPLALDSVLSGTVKTEIDKLFTSAYGGVHNGDTAAAFQLALWEIVNEPSGPNSFSTGNFTASGNSGILSAANTLLANLATAGTGGYQLTTWRSSGESHSQDQIGVAPVPEPSTYLMTALGLGMVAIIGRRRKV